MTRRTWIPRLSSLLAVLVAVMVAPVVAAAALKDDVIGEWDIDPWFSDDAVFTVRSATRSEVETFHGTLSDRGRSGLRQACLAIPGEPPPFDKPASTFYSATFNWSGGGVMKGCYTDRGRSRAEVALYGAGNLQGSVNSADEKTMGGSWSNSGDGSGLLMSGVRACPSSSSAARRAWSDQAHAAAINEVRVVAVKPEVQFHKAGAPDDEWCDAEVDTVLKQGDEISCDPDGSVTLQFADNSTVVVSNTSQLKIASFFTEGGVVRTEILLKMGQVAAKVNKSEATKSDFRIKPPTAVASTRGTSFKVFADPVSKVSLISTTDGAVEVDPKGRGLKNVMVRAGKEVEVRAKSVSKLAPIGKAGARGGVNRAKAIELVNKVVKRGNGPCGAVTPRNRAFSTKPARGGWAVAVKLTGTVKGSSKWTVKRGKVKPANALAKKISKSCR